MAEKDRDLPAVADGPFEILSRQEAAEELDVSTRTFDRIQQVARIPFVIVPREQEMASATPARSRAA